MQPVHPSKSPSRILAETEMNRTGSTAVQQKSCNLSILVITWNMMGGLPTPKTLSFLLTPKRLTADVLVIGTQQCEKTLLMSFFSNSKECWEKLLRDYLQIRGFSLIDNEKLHGLHIIAFVKSNKMSDIQSSRSHKVKTGLYGTMGNKGAVSLTFTICREPFQFINAHLPSSHNRCGQRNDHLSKIVDKLIGQKKSQNVIFFGDMNYRLNVSGEESKSICSTVSKNELSYQEYAKNDQLSQQVQLTEFHKFFSQGPIRFPPTYKLSCEDNTYVHNRITGWTDRILFNNRDNKMELQDYYSDMYVMGSDHRPVFALFTLKTDPLYVPVAKNANQKKSNRRCLFL